MPISDHTACQLACWISTQCRELVECFFLLFKRTKSATAKFIATAKLFEALCLETVIFNVYLIQIHFESKFKKKLLFLNVDP